MPVSIPFVVQVPPQSGLVSATESQITGGVDIMFNGTVPVTSKGDFQLVTGDENLRRAIIRRLIVRPGEYKYRPNYGVGIMSYIKKGLTKSILSQLKHRIVDNLSLDRRVDRILSVDLTPTVFGNQTGLIVSVVVSSKGRTIRFQPFNFAKEN